MSPDVRIASTYPPPRRGHHGRFKRRVFASLHDQGARPSREHPRGGPHHLHHDPRRAHRRHRHRGARSSPNDRRGQRQRQRVRRLSDRSLGRRGHRARAHHALYGVRDLRVLGHERLRLGQAASRASIPPGRVPLPLRTGRRRSRLSTRRSLRFPHVRSARVPSARVPSARVPSARAGRASATSLVPTGSGPRIAGARSLLGPSRAEPAAGNASLKIYSSPRRRRAAWQSELPAWKSRQMSGLAS